MTKECTIKKIKEIINTHGVITSNIIKPNDKPKINSYYIEYYYHGSITAINNEYPYNQRMHYYEDLDIKVLNKIFGILKKYDRKKVKDKYLNII